MSKRIAMVGSGAVGGYVAGHMVRNGAQVTLVDAWPDHVEKMNADGLSLRGTTDAESHEVPVNAINICEVSNLPKDGPVDIAFISVKSYETQFAAALIRDYLAPDGFVVSLQNAINEEAIADVVGAHRVIGCIASSISCGLEGPALVRRHVPIRGDSYTVFRDGAYVEDGNLADIDKTQLINLIVGRPLRQIKLINFGNQTNKVPYGYR